MTLDPFVAACVAIAAAVVAVVVAYQLIESL